MRVGVLTGGGDCPGLNGVIRAIVRKGEAQGDQIVGFFDAWDGVMEQRTIALDVAAVRDILPKGGTILGTRRGSPFESKDGVARTQRAFVEQQLDALIVIGGNGSLTVASMLHQQHGLPVIGVPKTIDNDVVGTDVTIGFQTAVQIATDAIDRLHTTAESHDRVMVVEVMGRDAGWIALHSGIAGGATAIVIPEMPFDIVELATIVARRHDRGRYASVVVVAEGARPKNGQHVHGDISYFVSAELAALTGYESRVVQLGYVQRGGTPTASDRILSTRFGLAAIDAVHEQAFGQMVVLRCDQIVREAMTVTQGRTRTVDLNLFKEIAATFFG